MIKRFIKLINDSRGATAIEYGLIAALIAVAAKIVTTLNTVSSSLYAYSFLFLKLAGVWPNGAAAFSFERWVR